MSINSIGQSALAAAQFGLSVTSNNIANAATPGYSRQSTVQVAGASQNMGSGHVGTGVRVVDIRRSYDTLLAAQMQSAISAQGASASYLQQIARIDDALGNTAGGVGPAIQQLFTTVQALTTNAQSTASRQALMSAADSLSARFQGLSSQVQTIRSDLNAQITVAGGTISSLATRIAGLNESIGRLGQGTQQANDLLDQRDLAISELSKQVKVSVIADGSGAYNVILGNGQPLVMGSNAASVITVPSSRQASDLVLAYSNAGQTVPMEDGALTGGNVGGLMEFRSESLTKVQNTLGQIALSLSSSVNAQNRLGVDQDGKLGGNLFSVPGPQISAGSGNLGTAVAGATVVSAQNVTASDYTMQFDGTQYNIKRLDTGQVSSFSGLPATVDGVEFALASGAPATGDTFLVRPTAGVAAGFTSAITSTRQIAASAPVVTGATIGNTGTAKISSGTVDATYAASPLASKFTLTFSGGVLSGFPDGSAVNYADGAPINYGGMSFSISGAPGTGDTFTIGPNGANSADGSNASKIGGLQMGGLVDKATFQGAFASVVGWVGDKTQEMKSMQAADTAVQKAASESLTSVAGVNLDEEAANLLKYQQAYQVAGKLMATANEMFGTLLSLLS